MLNWPSPSSANSSLQWLKFLNEVECDALPSDVCGLSLGVLSYEIGTLNTNNDLTDKS